MTKFLFVILYNAIGDEDDSIFRFGVYAKQFY